MFACVVLLTKDEYDIIDDCLEYYGRMLGGKEHVVVVDNGSSHPKVLDAYEAHKKQGGTVIVDTRSFKDALHFMSEHMRALASKYEWILPMETDEIVYELGKQDAQPEDIGAVLKGHLKGLKPEVGLVRYGKVLGSLVDPKGAGYVNGAYSRPIVQMNRFYDQGWDKLILRSAAFVKMTLWCHHAELKPGYGTYVSDVLGLLHFHDTGLRRQVERSKPVVEAYGYFKCDDDLNTQEHVLSLAHVLRDQPIACGHKVRYLSNHYARLATLRAFKRTLGRMPTGVAEMERYSTNYDRHPAGRVRLDFASGTIKRNIPSAHAFGELLYHEMYQSKPGEERHCVVMDPVKINNTKPAPVWVTGLI